MSRREPSVLDREPADAAGTGVTRPADDADTERQALGAAQGEAQAGGADREGDETGAKAEPSAEAEPRAEGAPSDDADAEPSAKADDTARPKPTPAAPPVRERERARNTGRRPATRQGPVFYAGGFWRRTAAALIDLAVIVPSSLILAWIAGAIAGLELPPSRHRGLDFWVDLLLASDPAFLGAVGLTIAIGLLYALVFQLTTSRTLGMRALKLRIIDLYGDQPSTSRVLVRTAGYLAGLATLGLGFLWAGFDSEKRTLHDWLSGTFVVNE